MRLGIVQTPQSRIYAIFFLYSLVLGGIFPRLGDLQLGMGIGVGALGASIAGIALGTQIALLFVGPFLQRFGHRAALLVSLPALATFEALATLAPSPLVFFSILIFAGLSVGTIEVVINLEADRIEYQLKHRIMNRAHAFWSFGFFSAGFISAAAQQGQIGPSVHLLSIGLVGSVIATLVLINFRNAPAREKSQSKAPIIVRPTRGIMVIVAFTLSAMLLEGASIDWSVIYMRDVFATAPFINALAFASGAFAQGAVRFFADGFIDRFGPAPVARTLVFTLGVGASLVVVSSDPWLSIFGFALIGAGGSVIFPMAISAAAQRTDRPAATNVAALAQISFITFLVAPPLLGFVAEQFGIRLSFAVGLPLVILSWFTISSLRPNGQEKAPSRG